MHLVNRSLVTALCSVVALCSALTSCSPQPEVKTSGDQGATKSCAPGGLATEVPGKLTVGTDKPAYAPWFADDKPSNGKGSSRRWRTPWPSGSATAATR